MKMSPDHKLAQHFIRVLSETEMTASIAKRENSIVVIGYKGDRRLENLCRETWNNPDSINSMNLLPHPGWRDTGDNIMSVQKPKFTAEMEIVITALFCSTQPYESWDCVCSMVARPWRILSRDNVWSRENLGQTAQLLISLSPLISAH